MTNTDREKTKEALEAVVALKVYLSCQPITCVCRLNSAPCCYCSNRTEAREQAEKLKSVLTDLSASQADTKPAGGEWLPIESAPRDGTEILAYWSLGHGSHGCTKFLKGEWVNPEDCDDEYCAPDFWQPLPAPPLTRKENGE